MDGISAQWAFSVYRSQCRLEEQDHLTEQENDRLRTALAEVTLERDRVKAQFLALHRKQFKAGKTKPLPSSPEDPASSTVVPKKRGPPTGHPPWTRPPPDHIDRVVDVAAPKTCPHCACDTLAPSSETCNQLQEDIILQPRTHVTQFRHSMSYCPVCRRAVYATAREELRHSSIGPVTKAVAVWLHHGLKLPFRPIRELFTTLFGMKFVPASALNFSLAAAHKGRPLYEDLKQKVRSAWLLHLDETSWRLDGKSAWLWYAGNADLDFFHIASSRATAVILEMLGDDYRGDFVSDGYAVYNALLARWRQTCLAHIIRTAKEIAVEIRLISNGASYADDLQFLDALAHFFAQVCRLDRQRRSHKLPRTRARAMIPKLRRQLKALCTTAIFLHPKTINLRDRLLDVQRDAKRLFTFLSRPGMPPTNNHAERALRGPVISRKISFGSRSNRGADAFALLASLLGTAKRQERSPLNFLKTLFTADAADAQVAMFRNAANTS